MQRDLQQGIRHVPVHRFRSKFLAEFRPEDRAKDIQDSSAVRSAAASEMCEPAPLRGGHTVMRIG